jgi:hypothetical protein
MLLGLDFMPSDQIGHMSLNSLKRRVETRDKNQTETWMGNSPVSLDPENQVSTRGGSAVISLLSFFPPEKQFSEYLRHYGFGQ